jgi:hypothetical protein
MISPTAKVPKLPSNVKLALLTFLLAGSLVAAIFPNLVVTKGSTPPFGLFLATGLAIVALTGGLFAFLSRLGLGFGKTALTLGLGYNLVIAVIKMTLSPYALYVANRHSGGFDTNAVGDPNGVFYYVFTAGVVLLLYVVAFNLIYRDFVKRQQKRLGQDVTSKHISLKRGFLVLILGLVGIAMTGGVALVVPLLFFGVYAGYLHYVFTVLGPPLLAALGLAIFLAYRGFATVEQRAITTGNATLLASFFWLGLSLILLYHVLWIVFMVTLVNIWPFSTYTSK